MNKIIQYFAVFLMNTILIQLLFIIFQIFGESLADTSKRGQFRVWFPNGRLILLPCNIDSQKFNELNRNAFKTKPEYLLHPQVLTNPPFRITTIWYNKIGSIIYIGEVIPIHLPALVPGELDYFHAQVLEKASPNPETFRKSVPQFRNSMDLLNQQTMSSISCKTFKSQSTGFFKTESLTKPHSLSMEDQLIYNQFSVIQYIQPLIIWSYAIPEGNTTILNAWRKESEDFCKEFRNISEYQSSPCLSISINSVSMEFSVAKHTNLTVTLKLDHNVFNLLQNPDNTNRDNMTEQPTLSYLHAVAKSVLDYRLLKSLQNTSSSFAIIQTSFDLICPTGTHSKIHPFRLPLITTDDYANKTNIFKTILSNESAYKLTELPLICEACPPGYAQITPYGYGPCQPCPRGHFRGETGWPSAAGCIACPEGYNTLQEGSTSSRDCIIDGGLFARFITRSAAWIYYNFMELIIASYETSKTYQRRSSIHVNSDREKEENAEKPLWLNRIHLGALILAVLYFLLIIMCCSLCCYRACLIYRFKKIQNRHVYLLKKSIVNGQLNALDDIKDFLRQDFYMEEGKLSDGKGDVDGKK